MSNHDFIVGVLNGAGWATVVIIAVFILAIRGSM